MVKRMKTYNPGQIYRKKETVKIVREDGKRWRSINCPPK